MPPIFFVPTSVKTHKKWLLDIVKTPFVGGYLVILIALAPVLLISMIFIWLISARIGFIGQSFWLSTIFLSGVLIFPWDKWLRLSYGTEIKIVFIPFEYYSYIIIIGSLIYLYA